MTEKNSSDALIFFPPSSYIFRWIILTTKVPWVQNKCMGGCEREVQVSLKGCIHSVLKAMDDLVSVQHTLESLWGRYKKEGRV